MVAVKNSPFAFEEADFDEDLPEIERTPVKLNHCNIDEVTAGRVGAEFLYKPARFSSL